MIANPWAIGLTILGFTGLVLVILQLCRFDSRLSDRIRTFNSKSTDASVEEVATGKTTDTRFLGAVRRLGQVLLPRGEAQRSRLQLLLMHAGYYSASASTWYVIMQLGLAATLFGMAHFGGR